MEQMSVVESGQRGHLNSILALSRGQFVCGSSKGIRESEADRAAREGRSPLCLAGLFQKFGQVNGKRKQLRTTVRRAEIGAKQFSKTSRMVASDLEAEGNGAHSRVLSKDNTCYACAAPVMVIVIPMTGAAQAVTSPSMSLLYCRLMPVIFTL